MSPDHPIALKHHTIVPARAKDLSLLTGIELAAASLLTGHAPQSVLSATTSGADFEIARRAGQLLVVLVEDAPVGFALIKLLEADRAHLDELDVHPAHGRQGFGRALVVAVCEWAAVRGLEAVTLSTFREVPWNMPFYARMGFEALVREELTPALRLVVEDEERRGLDTARRTIMRRATSR